MSKSHRPPLPSLVPWSQALLRGRSHVAGVFFLRRQGLLEDYLGVCCEHASPSAVLGELRELLGNQPEVMAVAQAPDLCSGLAFLHRDGSRMQWGVEELENLHAGRRLRDAVLLFGNQRVRSILGDSREIKRGASAEQLADVERLFWIDAAYAAERLAAFEVGSACAALDRLKQHLWSWIDVREMEKQMRERAFPDIPDSPRLTHDADDLRRLADFLVQWVVFYKQVRAPIARTEGIPLDPSLVKQVETDVRAMLRDLKARL